ncbi:MAG: glycoside hydrolase family 31 protein [candidate division KSB1 bacterium]|nr:glycoside hydrolase family 31 protein [candidate division KSB1 bacterium]
MGRLKRPLVRWAAGILLLGATLYAYLLLPFWGWPIRFVKRARPPLTPPWALECWLWEDDSNTAARVEELLQGYARHDIPVRVILIDSPWSTRYNDFEVDSLRYPNPSVWFRDLEQRGYRVVLWMTCMVNSRSEDTRYTDSRAWFEEARQRGYLAGGGFSARWWKGEGGFLDYTHPEALQWWRGMQDRVLQYGVDGWKLDETATLFSSRFLGFPVFYQRTHSGILTTRKYMDLYYRLEYGHGLEHNPEFITLVRGIDRSYVHPEGFAPLDAAPVVWVGDQEHAWSREDAPNRGWLGLIGGDRGLREAIKDVLLSARRGYCVVGSDVGGYAGSQIPPRLYIRWAQFSAFCGLFLNGGHGERRLWLRSREELEIIRKFSWLHTELVPYMYSYVVRAHLGEPPLIRPTGDDFQYLFGDYLLVAPIYRDAEEWEIRVPRGRWYYLFDDSVELVGPSRHRLAVPLDQYPVLVREGAIIPLSVRRSYTEMGDEGSEGFVTLLIYPAHRSGFELWCPDRPGRATISVERDGPALRIHLRGAGFAHILRVHLLTEPESVLLDGKILQPGARWHYDPAARKLIVKTLTYETGDYEIRLQTR